jgi:hypothetical protein
MLEYGIMNTHFSLGKVSLKKYNTKENQIEVLVLNTIIDI